MLKVLFVDILLALVMSRDEAQDYVRIYGEPACIIGQFSSGDGGVIRVHQHNS